MPSATATDHAGLLSTLMGALEGVVHDERVPNEVSQELAEVLILARRSMAQGDQQTKREGSDDLIRFDFINADGRPDSKIITHDEMRERYAARGPAAEQPNFNPEHTLFCEIRGSMPVNEDGEQTRYLINEQQLQRVRAMEFGCTQAAPDEQIVFGCNRCGQTQQTWTAQCVHCNPVPQPQLAVWYGSLPESNGKSNWTVLLHRAGEHFSEGITVERGEYPDRVRYEADRFRYLIGELKDEPCVLDYDADLHSGYAGPQR